MTTSPSIADYRFVQVDVFTDHIFGGNPLAVFFGSEGLSGEQMQAIAREMNLSETVFLLPPTRDDCVARVRIFTPGTELPFAGHPTIGTAFVLATHGLIPNGSTEFRLEEKIGPVPVRLEGEPSDPTFIWMQQPPAAFKQPLSEPEFVLDALGLTSDDRWFESSPLQVGSNGVTFLYVPLRDREAVDRASMNESAYLAALGGPEHAPGAFIFAPEDINDEYRAYSRMLGTRALGMAEDPATGSASGPLGAYLVKEGIFAPDSGGTTRITSEQGTKMGRQSFIHITIHQREGGPMRIEVGGSTVPVLDGTLRLAGSSIDR